MQIITKIRKKLIPIYFDLNLPALSEITFKERLTKCFTDLNNVNKNK